MTYSKMQLMESEQCNVWRKCPSYLSSNVCGSHWTMKLLDLVIKLLNVKNQETRKILTWPKIISVFLNWKDLQHNLKLTYNNESSSIDGAIIKKGLSASGVSLSCRVANISLANK